VQPGEVVIVPYRDGPYLVRGTFELRDQSGASIHVRRKTIALCRCGKSRTRPFCDGTHRVLGFKAPSHEETNQPPRSDRSELPGARATANGRNGRTARDADNRSLIAVQHALRTARAGVELAAEEPCTAGAYMSLRTAMTLLASAQELLDSPQRARADLDGDWRRSCGCLIDGALDALAKAGETGGEVGAAADRVVAVSKLLRSRGGRP
jgi:CDGSH-type Zn-finger protein